MTSCDAEQREAKKKGGKDGYITREGGRQKKKKRNWDNVVVQKVQQIQK